VLALKRARPRLALFAATFGVVFLLSALAVGLSGYLAGSATAGARAGLAALTGSSGAFRVTIPLASDRTAQDSRVTGEIRASIRSDGARVPVRVYSDIETLAAVELDGPRGVVRPALASIPGLAHRANLISGRWPTGPTEASIQADAAASLGVRLGDRFTLPGGARVTIVGTWRVSNAADPAWLSDGIATSGLGYAGLTGFVVIDPSLWPGVGSAPVARWTVLPDVSKITPSQLAALQNAPETVPLALQTDKRNGSSVDQDGRLQPGMVPIVSNIQAATAVAIAPLVIVAVLGLVTLIELARMLSQFRAVENQLLRARGATRARLALSAAAEGAIVAIPAAAIGALGAAAVLPLLARASPVPDIGLAGAAAAAVAAIVVLAVSAGLATPDDSPRPAYRGERVRGIFGIAVVVLTILAAIVAVSQFVQYGSPLTTTASGGIGVDPLAVTAPALALAALSLIGLALFPLVSRAAERIAHRQVGLGSLPVQQLARRDRAAVTPVLLVALAIGGLVFAATYSGTWHASSAQTRAVHVGTSVRVFAQAAPPNSETHPVPGQTASSPAGSADVQVGDSLVPMLELPVARLGKVITPVAGAVDPAQLSRDLADAVALPAVPEGTRSLDVSFVARPSRAQPTGVDVTVVDAIGAISTIDGFATRAGFRVKLPAGTAPFVVRAIDVHLPAVHAKDRITVQLVSAENGAEIPLGSTWILSDLAMGHLGFETLSGADPGITATSAGNGSMVRLQPRAARGVRVPIVITAALAKSAGLRVGGQLDLPLVASGGDIEAVVTGVVPVIPGLAQDEGVLADLGSVQDAVLRAGLHNTVPSEWWIATDDPNGASHWLASRIPVGAVVETNETVPADEVLGSANTAVWIAAVAIALLGMLAVAAGLLAELRARLGEVALLRALGVGRRPQARGRALEVGVLLVLGLLAGLVDGVIVSALIVPDLARTAVPGALAALPTVLTLDVIAGVGSVLAVVAVAGILLVATATTVRRQAALATGGEGRR
jgi:hypothetical protein